MLYIKSVQKRGLFKAHNTIVTKSIKINRNSDCNLFFLTLFKFYLAGYLHFNTLILIKNNFKVAVVRVWHH